MKALIVNICISLTSGIFIYQFLDATIILSDQLLESYFDLHIGNYELIHIVCALSIALLPLYALTSWYLRMQFTFNQLFRLNEYSILVFTLVLIGLFTYLIVMLDREDFSEITFIRLPSIWFWNYVFVTASLCSGIFIIFLGLRFRSSRNIQKNQELDQFTNLKI